MKILTYKYYQDKVEDKVTFDRIDFGDINLIAGLSGVGKTRILNTIYNLSLMIQKKKKISYGNWEMKFKINKNIYEYNIKIKKSENSNIIKEEIIKKNEEIMLNRNKKKVKFNNTNLPKLSQEDFAIYIYREEEVFKEIYNEFCKINIRRYNPHYYNEPEMLLGAFPRKLLSEEKKKIPLNDIHSKFLDVNTQLFFIKEYYPDIFKNIEKSFIRIFPFVKSFDIVPISEIETLNVSNLPIDAIVPVLMIYEKGIKHPIPIVSISAGMMRAITQLVDINTMANGSIYLIDEIENSMGVKSLPIMIDILFEKSDVIQYIFTTHHPYIINNVNVKYWKILTRQGSKISVENGETLFNKFNKSSLDFFIQLVNSKYIENGI